MDCFRRSRFLRAADAADRSIGADEVTGDGGGGVVIILPETNSSHLKTDRNS